MKKVLAWITLSSILIMLYWASIIPEDACSEIVTTEDRIGISLLFIMLISAAIGAFVVINED